MGVLEDFEGDEFDYIDALEQEVEAERAARRAAEREYLVLRDQTDELERKIERLRKAVNWLSGDLDSESWGYKCARAVLEETGG